MREYIKIEARVADTSDVQAEDAQDNGWSDIEMIWDDVVTITGDPETARQVWEYLIGEVPACGNRSTDADA